MTTQTIANTPLPFWPAPAPPAPDGLFSVTEWPDNDGQGDTTNMGAEAPDRFILAGVQIRNTLNYGSSASTNTWTNAWDTFPVTDVKQGQRLPLDDPILPVCVYAFDSCGLDEYSAGQDGEILADVRNWLELTKQVNVEKAFSKYLLALSQPLPAATDFMTAVGQLEADIRLTGTPGFIHSSALWAPALSLANYLVRDQDSGRLKTPLGTTWCFGGGYGDSVDGLGTALIATSQPWGWSSEVTVITTAAASDDGDVDNLFVAIAECNYAVGVEKVIGAQVIATT